MNKNNNKKSYEDGFCPIPQLMGEALLACLSMSWAAETALLDIIAAYKEAHSSASVPILFPLLVIIAHHVILEWWVVPTYQFQHGGKPLLHF